MDVPRKGAFDKKIRIARRSHTAAASIASDAPHKGAARGMTTTLRVGGKSSIATAWSPDASAQ